MSEIHSSFSTPLARPLEAMDLHQLLRILRRRARLIAGVTLAGALAAFVIALLLPSQYRAEVIVMLNARQTHIVNIESVMSGLPADSSALRSEMDIIGSRAVVDRVIAKLKLTEDPEFYRAARAFFGNPLAWFAPQEKTAAPTTAEEEKTRSQTAKALGARLRVLNDGRSWTIRVSFASKEPQKAAAIANSFADEYLVDQLEAKYDAAARVNAWLSERLEVMKGQVQASEKAVEDFRQKAKLIQVSGATVVGNQMEEVSKQLIEARATTAQNEARVHSAANLLKS